jgi:hypothetical protein
MKKAAILFMLFSFNLAAFAQEITCLEKLLPFNRHSGTHQLDRNEWNDGKDVLDEESARVAVTFLTNSKLLCKAGEVVINIDPVCAQIIAGLPQSNTCFLFTNLGYFIISRDNGKNVNFIFSKDKTFSPSPIIE